MKTKNIFFIAISLLLICSTASQAAYTYGFAVIADDDSNPVNAAIGENQLSVDVSSYGDNQVLFTFQNVGPEMCSIADIYFRDGSLFGIASIIDADDGVGGDLGVDFSTGANPANLPGGGTNWKVSSGFIVDSIDSDSPTQPNGVNPGETLGIIFNLQSGKLFDNVIEELESKVVQIGIHVQGFEDDGSESFINNTTQYNIPAPGAIVLGGLGVLLVGWIRKRHYI